MVVVHLNNITVLECLSGLSSNITHNPRRNVNRTSVLEVGPASAPAPALLSVHDVVEETAEDALLAGEEELSVVGQAPRHLQLDVGIAVQDIVGLGLLLLHVVGHVRKALLQ